MCQLSLVEPIAKCPGFRRMDVTDVPCHKIDNVGFLARLYHRWVPVYEHCEPLPGRTLMSAIEPAPHVVRMML